MLSTYGNKVEGITCIMRVSVTKTPCGHLLVTGGADINDFISGSLFSLLSEG